MSSLHSKFYILNSRRGFTLIEILIVVAIIGILASVVLVGLGPVQRRGRDARRLSDLREAQNALELYFNKCGYYPGASQAGVNCSAYSANNSWGTMNPLAGMTGALIQSNMGIRQVPNDPTTGRTYLFATDGTGTSYVIGATLEDDQNPALREDIDGSVYGVGCDDPVYCTQF